MFKRVLAPVLSLLVALAVLPVLGAAEDAAASYPVEFRVGSAAGVVPGDTVSIPVYVLCERSYAAHCLRLSVTYDPQMLSVASVAPGAAWELLPWDSMKMLNYRTPGSVDISILCPTDAMTGEGCLLYINFVVSEACTGTEVLAAQVHEFFVSPVETGVSQDIPYFVTNGFIRVYNSMPGDANDDGIVNYLDISFMYLFIIGESELSPQGAANADFNGDGIISYLDISDLYMFLISA